MKAARRDAKRQAAAERRRALLEGAADSLVTKDEREKLWAHFKQRGASDAQTVAALTPIIAQLEAARREEKRLVKPVNGEGLLVPGGRTIISPEEARGMAMPQQ